MSNKSLAEREVPANSALRQTPPRSPTPMPIQEIAVWTPTYILKSAFAGWLRLVVSRDVETSRVE